MKVNPASEDLLSDKDSWKAIGLKILNFMECESNFEGIGKAIDLWRDSKPIPEQEMIDGLGFLFGDLCIEQYGGRWVMVEDQWGVTPAIEAVSEQILYALDIISKRLRDSSSAEKEIPSIAHAYSEMN